MNELLTGASGEESASPLSRFVCTNSFICPFLLVLLSGTPLDTTGFSGGAFTRSVFFDRASSFFRISGALCEAFGIFALFFNMLAPDFLSTNHSNHSNHVYNK